MTPAKHPNSEVQYFIYVLLPEAPDLSLLFLFPIVGSASDLCADKQRGVSICEPEHEPREILKGHSGDTAESKKQRSSTGVTPKDFPKPRKRHPEGRRPRSSIGVTEAERRQQRREDIRGVESRDPR